MLGFTQPDTSCKATLSNLLRCRDIEPFEGRLLGLGRDTMCRAGPREIAIDGKALRESGDGSVPGVHLLAAYAPGLDVVLAQLRVDCSTNEHKAALELLKVLPLKGAIVTADAMFTHADFSRAILKGGGDYILPVKDNQPRLLTDIALAFETPQGLSPPDSDLTGTGGRPPTCTRARPPGAADLGLEHDPVRLSGSARCRSSVPGSPASGP